MKTVRVVIEGEVQGVWYRGWTVDEASRRGLSGWVRNRRGGTVEAVFAGDSERVDDMIAACWNGPPAARVRAVHVHEDTDAAPAENGFYQAPTA